MGLCTVSSLFLNLFRVIHCSTSLQDHPFKWFYHRIKLTHATWQYTIAILLSSKLFENVILEVLERCNVSKKKVRFEVVSVWIVSMIDVYYVIYPCFSANSRALCSLITRLSSRSDLFPQRIMSGSSQYAWVYTCTNTCVSNKKRNDVQRKSFFTRRSNDSLSFYVQTTLQTYHILGGHYTLCYIRKTMTVTENITQYQQ